jgi:hypothetical protein
MPDGFRQAFEGHIRAVFADHKGTTFDNPPKTFQGKTIATATSTNTKRNSLTLTPTAFQGSMIAATTTSTQTKRDTPTIIPAATTTATPPIVALVATSTTCSMPRPKAMVVPVAKSTSGPTSTPISTFVHTAETSTSIPTSTSNSYSFETLTPAFDVKLQVEASTPCQATLVPAATPTATTASSTSYLHTLFHSFPIQSVTSAVSAGLSVFGSISSPMKSTPVVTPSRTPGFVSGSGPPARQPLWPENLIAPPRSTELELTTACGPMDLQGSWLDGQSHLVDGQIWRSAVLSSGKMYYVNTTTKETAWSPPSEGLNPAQGVVKTVTRDDIEANVLKLVHDGVPEGADDDDVRALGINLYSESELVSNSRDAEFGGKQLLHASYADLDLFRGTSVHTIPRFTPEFSDNRLKRPQKRQFIHGGRVVCVHDPSRPEFQLKAKLSESEFTRCDDPQCNAICTPTAKFSTARVPKLVKSPQGDSVICSRMYFCRSCKRNIPSMNNNNLSQYPPSLIRSEFGDLLDPDCFDDVSTTILSRDLAELTHTLVSRGDCMDTVSEYYNKAMLKDKAERMSDWWFYNGAYRNQLEQIVGDDVWGSLPLARQQQLVAARADYITNVRSVLVEDITAEVYSDAALGDAEAVKLALTLIADKNRVLNRRFMDSLSDGVNVIAVSLDWTSLSADHLGDGESEKWFLTVVDDKQRLIGAVFTPNTALSNAKPLLLQLKANGCRPKVAILDNLPPTVLLDTGMVRVLKDEIWPGSLEAVIQDRFHVVQNFCRDLNNKQDPEYHQDITMGLRRATRKMVEGKLKQVWALLSSGGVNKSVFLCGRWHRTVYQNEMDDGEIQSWLDLGVIDAMFCTGYNPVIPYESRTPEETQMKLKQWSNEVIVPKYFKDGQQIRVDGAYRLGNNRTVEQWNKKVELLCLRVVKAILPQSTGLREWKPTKRVDKMTKMVVIQQLFNTSGNESWHSRLEQVGGAWTGNT